MVLPANQLTKSASLEDIKTRLQEFKITALNLIVNQVNDPNAKYLEPKEIKTLTDVALNLEDSYKNTEGEGEAARKIKRLLDQYGDSDSMPPLDTPTSNQMLLEGELVPSKQDD